MSILDMTLNAFYDLMQEPKNVSKVNAELLQSTDFGKAKYEWVRFICLIEGEFNTEKVSWPRVAEKYLEVKPEVYSRNSIPSALATAIDGKHGNDAVNYSATDFNNKQIVKFNNGSYQSDWTVRELLEYIRDHEIHTDATEYAKKALDAILSILSTYTGKGKIMVKSMSIEARIEEAINKKQKKQIVLTGAPGTGKTYAVKKYVEDYMKEHSDVFYKFVQFHPSYDYSDFVEGLRPIRKNEQMIFERVDGCFKKFCRTVVEFNNMNGFSYLNSKLEGGNMLKPEDPLFFFLIDEINRADLSKVFGELMYCLEDSYRGKENAIPTQYSNLLTYDTEIACYLDEDVFADGFFIPQNVIIIGTMNDIDKSVEAFDFALRRRFEWLDIKANVVMQDVLDNMYGSNANIQGIIPKIISMNDVISGEEGKKFRLSEAYHIGPALFKGLDVNNLSSSLEEVFNNNIASTLREYTRGKDDKSVKEFIESCAGKLAVTYAG